jgi:hypothetical protein
MLLKRVIVVRGRAVDELEYIKKLAGVNEFKGYTEYTLEDMSQTATELKKKEKANNIKPGDKEWFELWFSKPYMTGHTFRGRKKK